MSEGMNEILFSDSFDNYGHKRSGKGSRLLKCAGWAEHETMKDDRSS